MTAGAHYFRYFKRLGEPFSSQIRSLIPENCDSRLFKISEIVAPSAVTSLWLLVNFMRGVGILTFTAIINSLLNRYTVGKNFLKTVQMRFDDRRGRVRSSQGFLCFETVPGDA